MIVKIFNHFRLVWALLRHPQVNWGAKAFCTLLPLLYATLPLPIPFDIPSIVPIVGMLDDLFFISLTSVVFLALCPPQVVREQRARLRGETSSAQAAVERFRHPQEQHDLAWSFFWIVGLIALSGTLVGFLLALTVLINLYLVRLNRAHTLASALQITEAQYPELYLSLQELQERLQSPALQVFIRYDVQMNAHTFGFQPPYAIVLTSALVERLKPPEVKAVLAHEIAHVLFGHTLLINLLTASRTGLERLIFNRWSRTCEYSADALAWYACGGDPTPLAMALVKLSSGITDHPIDLQQFLKQMESGEEKMSRFAEWFSTHPLVGHRIQRLLQLENEFAQSKNELQG